MLVVRKGLLVFGRYHNGYSRDKPHDLRSATKSITSLQTGIVIERDAVAGVDAPLMDYLARAYPDIRGKRSPSHPPKPPAYTSARLMM